jgi:hypothetical protein
METQTVTCYTCGAIVDAGYQGKHRSWHNEIDAKIKSAEDEARRAKRASRG